MKDAESTRQMQEAELSLRRGMNQLRVMVFEITEIQKELAIAADVMREMLKPERRKRKKEIVYN